MIREIEIFRNEDELSEKAASLFASVASACIREKEWFSAVISGGRTPQKFFKVISSRPAGSIDWEKTHVFWADERCVPADHPESNFGKAFAIFLSSVSIPEKNIHRIRGEEDPAEEARRYESEIRALFPQEKIPRFDLILLGMGEDGHTASLFPGMPSILEAEKLAVPVFVETSPSWRISLTLPVLNQARNVIFLVSGASKADTLGEILSNSEKGRALPAGKVSPHKGILRWIVDRAAAAKLTDVI